MFNLAIFLIIKLAQKIQGSKKPTPVFTPGESHGQRSLEGYGRTQLKRFSMHIQKCIPEISIEIFCCVLAHNVFLKNEFSIYNHLLFSLKTIVFQTLPLNIILQVD